MRFHWSHLKLFRRYINVYFWIKKVTAFTLIEIIIMLGVISLILPTLFSIVFLILQQQTKIIRLQEIKREGDFALTAIKSTIKNSAVAMYDLMVAPNNEVCNTANSTYNNPYFLDKNNNFFYFNLDNNQITSRSSNLNPMLLTSNRTTVTNLSLSCRRDNLYSSAIVSIEFDITYNTNSNRPEERTNTLHYQTKIKLKPK